MKFRKDFEAHFYFLVKLTTYIISELQLTDLFYLTSNKLQ